MLSKHANYEPLPKAIEKVMVFMGVNVLSPEQTIEFPHVEVIGKGCDPFEIFEQWLTRYCNSSDLSLSLHFSLISLATFSILTEEDTS
jgi:hypothetical protein